MIIIPYEQLGIPLLAPIFDERERRSGLFIRLDELDKPYRVDTLHKGDWTVSDRVGGEIKRIKKTDPRVKKKLKVEDYNDLTASLKDERIFSEINGLDELYDVNVLIIELEKGAEFFNKMFNKKGWQSLRLGLEIEAQTHVFFTHSIDETIDLIYAIWEREKKGKHVESATNKKPRPKTLTWQQRYLLSGLIDVGDKKTKELLEFYGTPMGVFNGIITQEILYTKSHNPKKVIGAPSGFGPQFYLKNKKLLQGETDEKE